MRARSTSESKGHAVIGIRPRSLSCVRSCAARACGAPRCCSGIDSPASVVEIGAVSAGAGPGVPALSNDDPIRPRRGSDRTGCDCHRRHHLDWCR